MKMKLFKILLFLAFIVNVISVLIPPIIDKRSIIGLAGCFICVTVYLQIRNKQ